MSSKHFLHIKSNTVGTSNELSFDVLDAARNELDGQKGIAPKSGLGIKLPKTTQAPAPSLGDTAALVEQDEVTRRKKARRAHAWRVRIIVGVVTIAVVAVAGTFIFRHITEKQDFESRFNALVAEFVETDKTLVDVDSLMGDLFNTDKAPDRERVAGAFPELTQRLQAVAEQANELVPLAKNDAAASAVARVAEAAQARIGMIKAAEEAFALVKEAEKDELRAKEIWDEAFAADQAAREAIDLANAAYDQASTELAQEKTKEAREQFEDVKGQLTQLENACKGLSLAAQKEYVDKRIEALDYAIAINEALLAWDRAAATEANESYNKADREATRLAEKLPLTLESVVHEVFEQRSEAMVATYQKERDIVSASDSVVRDYLGERA